MGSLQKIIEIFLYIGQTALLLAILHRNFDRRYEDKTWLFIVVFIIQCFVHYISKRWTSLTPDNYLLRYLSALLDFIPAFFPYAIYCLKGDNTHKSILIMGMIAAERILAALAFRISILIFGGVHFIFVYIVSFCFYFLYSLIFWFVRMHSTQRTLPAFKTTVLGVISAILFTAVAFPQISAHSNESIWIYLPLILLFALLSIQVMFVQNLRQLDHLFKMQTELSKIHFDKIKLEEAELLLSSTQKIRHDIKNHMLVMSSLLEHGQYNSLFQYFTALQTEYIQLANHVCSGNNVVDAILNRKITQMETQNIAHHVKAALTPELQIAQNDLATILFNLLDNAMEASKSIDHPFIDVNIGQKHAYVFIIIQNRVQEDVLAGNPSLITTKNDSLGHGIGLNLVKRITSTYQGHFALTQQGDMFKVSLFLSNECNL